MDYGYKGLDLPYDVRIKRALTHEGISKTGSEAIKFGPIVLCIYCCYCFLLLLRRVNENVRICVLMLFYTLSFSKFFQRGKFPKHRSLSELSSLTRGVQLPKLLIRIFYTQKSSPILCKWYLSFVRHVSTNYCAFFLLRGLRDCCSLLKIVLPVYKYSECFKFVGLFVLCGLSSNAVPSLLFRYFIPGNE